MAATTSFLLNSFLNHNMKSTNLQRKPVTLDVNGSAKDKYVSCCGLQCQDTAEKNGTTFGAIDSSMLNISLKQDIILDQKKESPGGVSDIDLGTMVKDKLEYRENFHIKSYEIGPDGTASIETLMNHLQETSINHVKTKGLVCDGYGISLEMCKKNLIWVMANIQLEVDRYPVWGDVVQVETWKSAFGKIGMRTNWMFSDCKTGEILIRASSILVMMNQETRKLSKFPKEVRAEFKQYFINNPPVVKRDTKAWLKPDENMVDYVCNGLVPRRSDLDLNQHVSNVKYIGWILESVPKKIIDNYEIASMTLEYCRECTKDDILQSHTFVISTNNDGIVYDDHIDCEHILQLEIGGDGDVIVRGRTRWRSKYEKRS